MSLGRVLFIDDDKNLLLALKRQLRNTVEMEICTSGQEGLAVLQKSPFPVVVADMQMPVMNGVALLKEVKRLFPDTVRIMLTGNADQGTAVKALNEGNVFRFVNKPCSQDDITVVLTQAFEHYRLVTAEKELLQKTLAGSVKLVTDLLAISAPEEFSAVVQRREIARKAGELLKVQNVWELELAFMLAPLLTHLLPEDLRQRTAQGQALRPEEQQILEKAPQSVRRLIENVPRLRGVAEILEKIIPCEQLSNAADRIGKQRSFGVNVRIVQTLRDLTIQERRGVTLTAALKAMLGKQSIYDVIVVEAIRVSAGITMDEETQPSSEGYEVSLKELCAGQKLLNKVETKEGKLLLAAGTILSGALIERILTYASVVGLKEAIRVDARMPVMD